MPQVPKPPYYGQPPWLCPNCGSPADIYCKCPRFHVKCTAGCWWHKCSVHLVQTQGDFDHAAPMNVCTCGMKGKAKAHAAVKPPERCASCGVGPTAEADVRTCAFDIPGEFNKDYPFCAKCRGGLAERIREQVGTYIREKQSGRNIIV